MPKPVPPIDRDKLRAWIRLGGDDLTFSLLDDAIDLLPAAKLAELVSPYIEADRFAPDDPLGAGTRTLLADVVDFDARSRAGHYYQDFAVNSRNCTTHSVGTRAFIADCKRLLKRCVTESTHDAALETRASLEVLFVLLRYIDECNDDVIFFADEGGAWQVGVDWMQVFPAWFRCLSKTATSEEYARLVVQTVDDFEIHHRDQHFAAALKTGTAAQRRALAAATNPTTELR
ncbi:MAG: hypothetical protein HY899_07090 [Deltaproteobacteria bacterium]|nr:hypothetical protein [Deltaproteobacteria bacterium]